MKDATISRHTPSQCTLLTAQRTRTCTYTHTTPQHSQTPRLSKPHSHCTRTNASSSTQPQPTAPRTLTAHAQTSTTTLSTDTPTTLQLISHITRTRLPSLVSVHTHLLATAPSKDSQTVDACAQWAGERCCFRLQARCAVQHICMQ